MSKTAERRFLVTPGTVEYRADDKSAGVISGYAARFFDPDDPGTQYALWDDLFERIMPGAFDRAIRDDDVRGLFNHDASRVLGRNKAKTMRLSVDAKGLRYEIDAPKGAADVVESIQRGDVTGASFSFRATDVGYREEPGTGIVVREIRAVELFDVGPVTFPAYEATSADARTAMMAEARSALAKPVTTPSSTSWEIDGAARSRLLDIKSRE